jgi:outer membrane protein assembly factor BamB
MSSRSNHLSPGILGVALLAIAGCGGAAHGGGSPASREATLAEEILKASGVRGGLVVHLGCGDGRLTAALRPGNGYLVHGLDTDPARVDQARRQLREAGVYGPVSVDRLRGSQLPYADNLANLLVVGGQLSVDRDELLRVLCPGGVTIFTTDNGQLGPEKGTGPICRNGPEGASHKLDLSPFPMLVKPWPQDIDQWTHYLHDPTNNAVSQDTVVGPPRQVQWLAGPPWTRSHDHLASVSAVASAGGRLFYIVDDGPIAAVVLEPKWSLVARDAFSGVELWRRPIPVWQWHLRGFRSGPGDLARRLVAVGQRVYVTLGSDAPLSALDAVTGQTIRTYEGTDHALEVLYHDGTLLVVAGDAASDEERTLRRGERTGFVEVRPQRPAYAEPAPVKRLLAVEADTGRLRWKKADAEAAGLLPTTLAAAGNRVFFQNADQLICLDAASGQVVWRADRPTSRSRPTWSAPTLVVYDDVVLSADRASTTPKDTAADASADKVEWSVSSAGGQAPVGELIALAADTGRRLWSCPARECYNAPVDVLVADGLVWTGDLVTARDPGITQGRDPKTGEVKRTRPEDREFFQAGMGHHRCYRNKATSRYLVMGRSGVEFIDLATGNALPHHWTRGVCQYGVIPCNGLLYVPPHSCACFITSKLNGFLALAPESRKVEESKSQRVEKSKNAGAFENVRFEKGPGYEIPNVKSGIQNPSDWPTYRHDAARRGATAAAVPSRLQKAWQTSAGGRLSAPVIADGRVFVAESDAHTIRVLSAASGQPVWSYTAGGRVDSPPTVWQGRVLFGSADGWVYCLRAEDGVLAWRFRAAPEDLRIVSEGQIESAWPVPGSVLVQDGVALATAGRSSYLDGGIRLCRLDAQTGRLLSETVLDHRDPQTGVQPKDAIQGTNMPGALPDVLSSDGHSVFLRHNRFDLEGQVQSPDVPHLFSAAGFLDDSWWHRTYWLWGTNMGTNYGGWPNVGNQVPAGRLLVFDDTTVYGFGRDRYFHTGAHVGIDATTVFHYNLGAEGPRTTQYQAFAISRNEPIAKPKAANKAKPNAEPSAKPVAKSPAKPAGKPKAKAGAQAVLPAKQYRWTRPLPILARAMVLAGDRLVVAGPPDLFQADDPVAAIEGRCGGRLLVLSAVDGKLLAEYPLDSPPAFDGLAAAGGKLYLATTDGRIVCFGTPGNR